MIGFSTNIAGINMHDGPSVLPMISENEPLTLIREPDNPVDPNAVLVFYGKYKLGYIPAVNARRIAVFLDKGGRLYAKMGHSGAEKSHIWAQVRLSEVDSTPENPLPVETELPKINAKPTATKKPKWVWIGVGLFTIFLVSTMFKWADNHLSVDGAVLADTTLSEPEASITTPVPNTWTYPNQVDKMDGTIYVAELAADNLLEFDFPYNGGSTAYLAIRKMNGKTDILLRVSKGQFMSNVVDGTFVRVKIDKKAPSSYLVLSPSDGSSDYVYFSSAGYLLKEIQKAKTVIIEAEFFQSGAKQMEFNVKGLVWR